MFIKRFAYWISKLDLSFNLNSTFVHVLTEQLQTEKWTGQTKIRLHGWSWSALAITHAASRPKFRFYLKTDLYLISYKNKLTSCSKHWLPSPYSTYTIKRVEKQAEFLALFRSILGKMLRVQDILQLNTDKLMFHIKI